MPNLFLSRIPRPILATAATLVTLGAVMLASVPYMAHAAVKLSAGTFQGQSDHVTSGRVTIEAQGDRTILVLQNDFMLDGAPAPTIGFSKGGRFDKSTEFATLAKLKGRQTYVVPTDIEVSAYDSVTIWCARFAVPLGSARLL